MNEITLDIMNFSFIQKPQHVVFASEAFLNIKCFLFVYSSVSCTTRMILIEDDYSRKYVESPAIDLNSKYSDLL